MNESMNPNPQPTPPLPKIIFTIDETLDADIADSFIDEKMEGLDFGQERIIRLHPQLSLWRDRPGKDRTMALAAYVKDMYEKKSGELEFQLHTATNVWGKIEKPFFEEMVQLLGPLDFYPHDTMIGKLSIFACAIIEDDGRSFQVLYSLPSEHPAEFVRGVAHEAVHFLTDAYMAKYGFTDLLADWNFREILPVIILNLPPILALTQRPENGYPQHQGRFLDNYKTLWSTSKNFLEFLKRSRDAKNEGATT